MLSLVYTSQASGQIYVGPIPNVDFKVGRVMARSIVLDPQTGQPILVEYNTDGTEAGTVDIGAVPIADISILPAADYRFDRLQLESYLTQYRDTLANGAEVLSRREFEQAQFKTADNQAVIPIPQLGDHVNSVLVRGQTNRILPDPDQLVLLNFSFDLTQAIQVGDDMVSLVVNTEGQIIAKSTNNIGYRTGFFGDPNEPQDQRSFRVKPDDEVFGPVSGVKVYVDELAYRGGVDVTDNDGKYSFQFYMPPCPIGGWSFTTDVWAELRYRNFLPIGSPSIPYYLRTPGYSYCYATLAPAFLVPTLIGIQAAQAIPNIQSNLYADVMFVTGRINLRNLNDEVIAVGDTTHTAFEEPAENVTQNSYDFNGDGQSDFVLQGRIETRLDSAGKEYVVFVPDTEMGDRQGIFFDGRQDGELDFPDLVRIIDQELRNEPVGMLKSISSADLRNTDVLFFRESTGQLIMERRGLKEEESEYRRAIRYDDEENEVAYRIMLRGPSDSTLNIGGGVRRSASYREWATENQLTEPFREKNSDQPRPGEYIKIVAINRATGYMGTARVQLKGAGDNGTGLLDVPVPLITLQPPNLKVWAERNYEVEKGLTEGEDRTYTIGSEGAALTSDRTITIYTDWLDEDDKPLPDELALDDGAQYGLTGRLAKVGSDNSLTGVDAGSDLSQFPIAPGRRTQVIRVGDNLNLAEHFYIHVIGKPRDQECVNDSSCPSFSQTGSEAPYDSRPQLLTPFYVPLADERKHWLESRAYRAAQSAIVDPGQGEAPIRPLPAYAWQYRPEYQFSQFELEVAEINRTFSPEPGIQETVSIIDNGQFGVDPQPVITSSDQLISFFYSLIASGFERLSPIDGVQELVLSLGEKEQLITIGEDQSITFENISDLSNLDPEDLLSIRLTTNNDVGNVLWEYAFEYAETIGFTRSISLGKFNADASNDGVGDITDSFLPLSLLLEDTSVVSLEVLDDDLENLGVLINNAAYDPGVYKYIVTYQDMAAYLSPGERFYLALNKVDQSTGKNRRDLYAGRMLQKISNEMLGQVIEHDTLIQRGSLTLRREDMQLKGVGPQLNFIRSYSNELKQGQDKSTLGPGWNHNHEIFLQVVATGDPDGFYGNNLPLWIQPLRSNTGDSPRIVPIAEFEELVEVPFMVAVSNGGLFKFVNNEWNASRGYHGELDFVNGQYQYNSKDGTTYKFSDEGVLFLDERYPRFYVKEIIDRNNNTLTYEYADVLEGANFVKSVKDATNRTLTFNYDDIDNVGRRLTSVTSSVGIDLEFEYKQPDSENVFDPLAGMMIGFERADFTEAYAYEIEPTDNFPNLIAATDARSNATQYKYLAEASVPVAMLDPNLGINANDVIEEVTYPGGTGVAKFDYSAAPAKKRTVTDLRGNDKKYTLNDFGNPLKLEEPLGKTTEMKWSIDEGLDDNLVVSSTDALGRETTFVYDDKGNITESEDPIGMISQSWNQDFSVLLERTDREGNTITNIYDGDGNLTDAKDAEGHTTKHTYNNKGLRRTTRPPGNGGTISYAYDNNGNMDSMVKAEGSSYSFTNDSRGRKTNESDANGNQSEFSYDQLDRLESIKHPDNFTTSYGYDAKGNKTSESDKLGLSLTYQYDDRDRVSSVSRNFGGGSQSFTYDNNSNLLSESDWKGQKTSHSYDNLNRRKDTTNRAGDKMVMTYDLVNNLKSEKDYRNLTTNYNYDDGDRLTSTINAIGDEMAYSYDKENNVLSESDYEGRLTQYTYDKRYLQASRINALNDTYLTMYDARRNAVSMTDELGRVMTYKYDRQNRKVKETDALGFVMEYRYDGNDNVVRTTDRRGFVSISTYDEINRLETNTDPESFVTGYTYDANDNRTSIEDGNGHVSQFEFDKLNRPIKEITAVGGQVTHTYDANNNRLTTNDAIGTGFEYAYDELDRMNREDHAVGSAEARNQVTSYDPNSNVLSQRNFRGFATGYTYDDLNRAKTRTDAMGQVTTLTYDGVNNKLSETNRRSFTTSYEYDDLNRLTTSTDALSQTIGNTYDKVGNVLINKDKRSSPTTNTFDDLNRLIDSTKFGIRLVKNEYDREDNIVAITDANGNRSQYRYDGRGLEIEQNNPDATKVTTAYDGVGKPLVITDEISQTTTNVFDNGNRLVSSTNFANETTQFEYDFNDNRTKVIQPMANTTAFVYDGLNRVSQITDPESNTTRYTYDGNDNQLTHTDANGNQVSYTYDNLDRRTRHDQPNGLVSTFSYDPEANMTGMADPNGRSFIYTFDPIDRQTSQGFPNATTAFMEIQNIATVYDQNNNPTSITETKTDHQNGVTVTDVSTMAYDLLDRETSNAQRGHNVTYVYDDNGNRLSVGSAGGSTAYTYDSRNRLSTATTGNGTSTYVYTGDSKQASITYPNGTITEYNYDNADRTLTVTNTKTSDSSLISSFAYQYDQNSNRTQQVETNTAFSTAQIQTTDYDYDLANRLTGYAITDSASATVQALSYTFDNNYNRIGEVETQFAVGNLGSATTIKDRTSTYDANNRLDTIIDNLSAGGDQIDYVYDNNGNTLSKTDNTQPTPEVTQFEYDSRNQLSNVIRGPPTAETNQGYYDYNYKGLRVRHVDSERGDIDYVYDGNAVLEERTLPSDATGGDNLIAHYRYSDRLISLNTATDEQYYHYSALSTTANLTNTSGDTQISYRTDIWGHITDQQGDSPNRQVFTGQEHDENTGLIYFGARYYDPDTARFINQDSYLGESSTPPSLHRYLYAYANPSVYVDLNGYESTSTILDKAAMEAANNGENLKLAGLVTAQAFYKLSDMITFGWITGHDDARDLRDSGQISDREYYERTAVQTVKSGTLFAATAVTGGAAAAASKGLGVTAQVVTAGSASSVAYLATEDAWKGELSTPGDYVKAAAYGAVTGVLSTRGAAALKGKVGNTTVSQGVAAVKAKVQTARQRTSNSVTAETSVANNGNRANSAATSASKGTQEASANVAAASRQQAAPRPSEVRTRVEGNIAKSNGGTSSNAAQRKPNGWNEFQKNTQGQFSSRTKAAEAYRAQKGTKGRDEKGPVIIGETMMRVEAAAAKVPNAKILNDMPEYWNMGLKRHEVTSKMMQYNRRWIHQQLKDGRNIIDIGEDLRRKAPSIFYQMEKHMLKNYEKLHPGSVNITTP